MSKIIWDATGEHFYENGVSHGVIYPQAANGTYPQGEGWNGLTSFDISPTGGESNPIYADNFKYLDLISDEEVEGSIGAYTYPDSFAECNGEKALLPGFKVGQQLRKRFGFSCQTIIGNDVEQGDYGYKIHLVYGAITTPSERSYETVNDSPEPIEMSWDFTTMKVNITGAKPVAHIELDSTKLPAAAMTAIENVLYGTASTEPRLPLPDEVMAIISGTVPEISLTALSVGSETLNPAFDADVTEYTISTTSSSAAVTASAASGTAVAILVNGESITNGDDADFVVGVNTIKITLTKNELTRIYTITVNRAS